MKRNLFFLLFAFLTFGSQAQAPAPPEGSATAKNSITLGWSGAVYTDGQIVQPLPLFYLSASYERRVWTNQSGRFSLLARGGIGTIFQLWGTEVGATGLIGKRNHHMAITTGAAFLFIGGGYGGWPIVEFAYRYQRPQGGLVWRAHVGTTGLGLGAGWAF